MEEILSLVLKEIKRSGYDNLLPAGIIFTGGSSALPGLRSLANRVLNLPARIAQPENMVGMTDKLHSPAFSTSMGLIRWALMMNELMVQPVQRRFDVSTKNTWETIKNFLVRLLP
jgi:cell division protein FtsA